MKKSFVFVLCLFFIQHAFAQKLQPVKWVFEAVKKSEKQYEIIATASIDATWHIYSQFVKGGPQPTTIQFNVNPLVQLNGKAKEMGKLEKNFDKNFGVTIGTFSGTVKFVQLINLKVASKTKLSGIITYTVCNDEKCLPPAKQLFEISLQ